LNLLFVKVTIIIKLVSSRLGTVSTRIDQKCACSRCGVLEDFNPDDWKRIYELSQKCACSRCGVLEDFNTDNWKTIYELCE
jgi:hypothetical protein